MDYLLRSFEEKIRLKKFLFFLFALSVSPQFYGQEKTTVKDSTELYKKIEDYSEKNKITKTLHKWLFRPTGNKPDRPNETRRHPNYQKYSGRIVRNIIIDTKDPFGFSMTDSTRTPDKWIERAGNSIHIKSKELAIRNFLLLKENKPLDTFLIAESARLLRAQSYIREVEITPKEIPHSKDSIDIVITSLDSWSLTPRVSFSTRQTKLRIRERNFAGLGHEATIGYEKRLEDGNSGFEAIYSVPNFKNTFINATGNYRVDYEGYYEKSISFDRVFYSPLTRWAGGIFLEDRFLERSLPNDTLTFVGQDLKYIAQDYWLGHAFRIFSGNTERERTTNLIISARALFINYRQTPSQEYDAIEFFSGENTYLANIGIASRQYIEDRYIFRDGIIEDVPVGIVYSVTGGIQRKNNQNRPYIGGRISYGNYFSWGFLSTNLEAGTYFNGSITQQTTYSFQASYFSNLLSLGDKWKMRQFIKPEFIIGVNRLDSPADRIGLNENPYFGGVTGKLYYDQESPNIYGFDSPMYGKSKYILGLQTQFYAPWVWWGFRVNPFLNMTFGIIEGKDKGVGNNKLYSSFGVGCIIRNDYLVFDAFQFSLAYYPSIPGQGENLFKTNAFQNDDFGFQDFEMGKPRTVLYE